MQHPGTLLQYLQTGLFLTMVAGVIWLYSLGWSGSLHFDDEVNLSGLEAFQYTGDWLAWLSSGQAGPGGRSLALASFLLDALSWPDDPSAFLYTNSLIHALNGLLLGLVLLRLTAALGLTERERAVISLSTALLWLLLPLLASSSLIVVQRMTTLAASFMLLGLYVYLLGRERMFHSPSRGLTVMGLGLGGGTLLGFLSKENAALLPLLVLVVETTLLHKHRPPRTWQWHIGFGLLLILPSLLIIAYLLNRIPGASFAHRDFSLGERLATQTVILWDYLRLMFIPRSMAFSPFHDTYPIHSWRDATVIIASTAWVTVITASFLLRTRWPLFAFAVFWYLGAHLIESTVIALELYFEHRNYIPAIGPIFALVVGGYRLAGRYRLQRLFAVIGSAYIILMALVLGQTTSLWGQPALAAEFWYLAKPDSKRAANFLARQHIANRDPASALRVLNWTQEHNPESAGLALQMLQLSCQLHGPEEQQRYLAKTMESVATGVVDTASIDTLQRLKNFVGRKECPETLGLETLETLATLALENPRLRGGRISRANFNLYLAEIQIERRDLNATMLALQQALDNVQNLDLLTVAMAVLNSAGLYDTALEFALEYSAAPTAHPLKRLQWEQRHARLLEIQRDLIAERQ